MYNTCMLHANSASRPSGVGTTVAARSTGLQLLKEERSGRREEHTALSHIHEHRGDLLWRILATSRVPLRKPVAHPKQTTGGDLGIKLRLQEAGRLALLENALEVAFVGLFAQINLLGERVAQVGCLR